MKRIHKAAVTAVALGLGIHGVQGVEISAADLAALKQQLAELAQKVNALERERDSGKTASTNAAPAASLSVGDDGVSFNSADTNFAVQLHGLTQVDSRSFFGNKAVNGVDGFLIRRARPILTGTLYRDFDFNFTPEFGGSTVQILDAYVNYRCNPAFQLQIGKFKSPVGLEQYQTEQYTLFNERSLVTDLVPYRDTGLQLRGSVFGGAASYAVGLVNGDTDYNSTTVNTPIGKDKSVSGRLFFQPWVQTGPTALRGLGFGVGGSYIDNNPQTNSSTGLTPGYTTDGQQKFFTYNSGVNADGGGWRISPQAYYYNGPLGLMGEYIVSDQRVASATKAADLDNRAWEVSASWVLTGENAAYDGVVPLHPFNLRSGQWGAWQIAARFAALNVDGHAFDAKAFADPTKSASGANAVSVGLSWYLNKNIRANLDFSHTTFEGFLGKPTSGAVSVQPENVLESRLQLSF